MKNINPFSTYLCGRGLAKRTVEIYMANLKTFTNWLHHTHGEDDLLTVTALDVADYRRYLLNQGRKPATVNLALDVLNSFYTWAVAGSLIFLNPLTEIKRVPEQKKAPRWLERKELNALMRTV